MTFDGSSPIVSRLSNWHSRPQGPRKNDFSFRGALGAVEFFPVAVQVSEMCAVAVGRDTKMHKRICLGADRFRHLFELDPVVAQQRLALHLHLQLVPCRQEIFGRRALQKIRGEERRVIVGQFLTQPAKPPRQMPPSITQSGAMKAMSPSAKRPTATTGRAPRRSPTCLCQAASQSKDWKAVQSAVRSNCRHSASTAPSSLKSWMEMCGGTTRVRSLGGTAAAERTSTLTSGAATSCNAVSVVARVTALTREYRPSA